MNYNKGYRINTKKNKNVSYECGRNDRIFIGKKIVFYLRELVLRNLKYRSVEARILHELLIILY